MGSIYTTMVKISQILHKSFQRNNYSAFRIPIIKQVLDKSAIRNLLLLLPNFILKLIDLVTGRASLCVCVFKNKFIG